MTARTMIPSSALVNVAEQAELSLIRLLSSHMQSSGASTTRVEEDCENLIAHADALGFVRRVLLSDDFPALSVLLSEGGSSEEDGFGLTDAVSAFSLLVALLQREGGDDNVETDAAEVQKDVAVKLLNMCEKNSTYSNAYAMGMLKVLFDLATVPVVKCFLFQSMVQLAINAQSEDNSSSSSLLVELWSIRYTYDLSNASLLSARQVSLLANTIEHGTAEKRALFHVVGKALEALASILVYEDSKAVVNELQKMLLLEIETYQNEAEVDANAIAAAKKAATGAVRDPVTLFSEQRNMLKLPAVLALKNSEPNLYKLLTIFTQGTLEEYMGFSATLASQEFFTSNDDLTEVQCRKNMRLLSLCSLASDSKTSEISYAEIKEALDIHLDEVEDWVIAARGSGMIDAKMDQIREIVTINRCVVRKFGKEQWLALQTKLNLWKENIRSVLDGLKEQQEI